jgi:folate-binding protein YgfZ
LKRIGIVRFTGPDVLLFLQGQLSNDTSRLTQGRPLLAAYSTPQGRVLALPHLIPHSSGILGLLPRDILVTTIERLRKFVMRAKVKLEDVSDEFAVLGLHGSEILPPSIALPAHGQEYREHDGIGVSRIGGGPPASVLQRWWVIGEAGRLTTEMPGSDAAAALERVDQEWRLANIRAGMPQIYAQTQEMFVAQMLNLDLLDGISFSKGCYTGQEIIARTQHLGRIKRRTFRLLLPAGAWQIGQTVQLADGRSGKLIEIAATGDEYEALAVLSLHPGVDAEASGGAVQAGAVPAVAAVELPLPYSLTTPA